MVQVHPGAVHSYFFAINLSKENYAIPYAESDYFHAKAFASHKHFIIVLFSFVPLLYTEKRFCVKISH
jgi:hypothetical protein